jgi:hypothetical protein
VTPAGTVTRLAGLAAWIDQQLADETASRQHIAEGAAERVRDIATTLNALCASDAATTMRPDGVAVLSAADRCQVLGALEHAATFLYERAAQQCEACSVHPAGCCDEHADAIEQAAAYRALAGRLGGSR